MEYRNKKLIPLDCDGVLNLGSKEAFKYLYVVSLGQHGFDPDEETIEEKMYEGWGVWPREINDLLLTEAGVKFNRSDKQLRNRVKKTFDDVYTEHYADLIKPVPGVVEALGQIASHDILLALNSSADPDILLGKILPKLGLSDPALFKGGMALALDPSDFRYRHPKPEPDPNLRLMKLNNVQPHETLVVGDSDADIRSAFAAGIVDVAVPLTGMLSREDAEEWSVEIIKDVTYLPQLLGMTALIEDF